MRLGRTRTNIRTNSDRYADIDSTDSIDSGDGCTADSLRLRPATQHSDKRSAQHANLSANSNAHQHRYSVAYRIAQPDSHTNGYTYSHSDTDRYSSAYKRPYAHTQGYASTTRAEAR